MLVSVRLFAGLRERAGAAHVDVELPDDATVADLLAALELGAALVRRGDQPRVRRRGRADRARRRGRARPAGQRRRRTVRRVRVTGEPLDVAALSAAVRDPRAGAVVLFEGVTRNVPELDYEAYAEMAEPRIARSPPRRPSATGSARSPSSTAPAPSRSASRA